MELGNTFMVAHMVAITNYNTFSNFIASNCISSQMLMVGERSVMVVGRKLINLNDMK
jgi:hypothetical protein